MPRPISIEESKRRLDAVAVELIFGRTTKQTARALGLSPKTIETRRQKLYRVYGVATHKELLAKLWRECDL